MDLRAGLVGLGMMGRNHARVMSSTSGVTFVGAVDPAGDQTGTLDKSIAVSYTHLTLPTICSV